VRDYEQCPDCIDVPIAPDNLIGRPQWELNAGVPFVGSPVHERMTIAAITLSNVHRQAYQVKRHSAYIHGVFFNDDPDDLLCPECSVFNLRKFDRRWGVAFATRFLAAKKQAIVNSGKGIQPAFGIGAPLLERSHFGDLQFLHGMASMNGERAAQTQKMVLAWAEFTYKTAVGQISQTTRLKDVPISAIRERFVGDAKLESMSVETFFGGKSVARRAATGSLLHMIQDSYAPGHVQRVIADSVTADGRKVFARGAIHEFHSYVDQDSDLHAKDDRWPDGLDENSLGDPRNPIAVGARILTFVYAGQGLGAPWGDVEVYLRTDVFPILDANAPAGPGADYVKKARP
jgi:hypothetical protein